MMKPAELKIVLLSKGLRFPINLFAEWHKPFYENQYVYSRTSHGARRSHRLPQGLCLGDGVFSAILHRKSSEVDLAMECGGLVIKRGDSRLGSVSLPEKPAYFGKTLSDGIRAENIIAVAGEAIPGFLLYPDCANWKRGVPCRFCALKPTRKTVGTHFETEITGNRITEATRLLQKTPWREIPMISITTGTFSNPDTGTRYIAELIRKMSNVLDPKLPIHLLTMPPKDMGLLKLYHQAGVSSIAFNVEVFDRDRFNWLCRGKDLYYGYEGLLQALDYAHSIFGDYHVYSGFVWGLEPAESTLAGYKYFLDRGISVSSNVFHADPGASLQNYPHPLESTIRRLCIGQTHLYECFPEARPIFPCSMRSTLDYEIFRGDFR